MLKAELQHKEIIMEYDLPNVTVSYDKIKYNIYETLAILKSYYKFSTILKVKWKKWKFEM